MELTLQIPDELMSRFQRAFGTRDIAELALLSLKRSLGEAELRMISQIKQVELQEEAKRLNIELGLAKE